MGTTHTERQIVDFNIHQAVHIHGIRRFRVSPDIDRIFDVLFEAATNAAEVQEVNSRVQQACYALVRAVYGPAPSLPINRQLDITPQIEGVIKDWKRGGGYGPDWALLNRMGVEACVAHVHSVACSGHYDHCMAPPELGDGPAFNTTMMLRQHRSEQRPQEEWDIEDVPGALGSW